MSEFAQKTALGIELGSTRIKAVLIDSEHKPLFSGDYVWKSSFENGIWTYSLDEVWKGLRQAVGNLLKKAGEDVEITAAGVSAMMHGYLAFDKDWNLLVPFRTWQNTITAQAGEKLTELFSFNIPQRWSIAHLYQAILNSEEHVKYIAHITTLAGYVHFMLTGENAVGIGEASGIFPVDSTTLTYNEKMIQLFDDLVSDKNFPWKLRDILPQVKLAGENAGSLSENGVKMLGGLLKKGILFAPAEGDAGTGMAATNAVAPGTGNISAGTSIFSMVVLSKPLEKVYPEIDIVATPTGKDVAMVHCNNCTNDMNAWISLINEALVLFGTQVSDRELYNKLYLESLNGESDCGDVLIYNYLSGEGVTHFDQGRPLVLRSPESRFTLANFMRSQLYSAAATLKIGMDLLAGENVSIASLTGHGGLFKTPGVGQRYMAAACKAPVTCMKTAGEGGPYGMALLAMYMINKESGQSFEAYLENNVFANTESTTLAPDEEDVKGFERYIEKYKKGLVAEKAAIETI